MNDKTDYDQKVADTIKSQFCICTDDIVRIRCFLKGGGRSYALKRSMKLSVCKICYDNSEIDGFDDIINMNVDILTTRTCYSRMS
jgi:hypothetical protein